MSNHLSQDQFSKCIAGRPSSAELQHIGECPECRAELERFGNTLALFRSAIRNRIGERVASLPSTVTLLRPVEAGISKWRWAWVAAAVVTVLVLPFFIPQIPPQEAGERPFRNTDANAVMERVNLHLSRIVPAPMEPMLSLLPSDESVTKPGGVQ
jgi:hypothetical protein